MNTFFTKYFFCIILIFACVVLKAQEGGQVLRGGIGKNFPKTDNRGRPVTPGAASNTDSLKRRNNAEDSITIYFKFFDSSRVNKIDSSINDFNKVFPLKSHHLYLSNLGAATRSILFNPTVKPGWDAGFHALDAYRFSLADTKFYQTNRPYTDMDFMIGSKTEQTLRVLHSQNITPLWNASFEYRLITAPGHFKNNNTSHSNLRFASNYIGKSKKLSGNFVYLNTRNNSSENGGIVNDSFLVSTNTAYKERFVIPTVLGGDKAYSGGNFLAADVSTGTHYEYNLLFLRTQFDLGKKDSTMNEDSTYARFFYPRFRLQHNLLSERHLYQFLDNATSNSTSSDQYRADVYKARYGLNLPNEAFLLKDEWRNLTNEFFLILFPDKNNQDQYFKAGAAYQYLNFYADSVSRNFNNIYLASEYRNRTRNRKWDINANAKLYLSGLNSGDYNVEARLFTNLGKKTGNVNLGFQNINRSPSFIFDTRSSFIITGNTNFKKENWTILNAALFIQKLKIQLTGSYFLISNYTYWKSFTEATQTGLENVLNIGAERTFKLNKRWSLYSELHAQKSTGSAINLPLIFTRQRLAFEGNFFKNLNLSTGIELRYFTGFKADTYSPFNGQFVTQNTDRISNFPDISAFLHFRIFRFRGFLRAENLNTMSFKNGFGFTNNNFAAPHYLTPGMITRFGVNWRFIN